MLFQHHTCWYLSTGPAEEERKVYLSAATLLVLPPTLIPHWLHQIRVHLKPNTLRVAVLAGDRASADEAVDGNTTCNRCYTLPLRSHSSSYRKVA